MNRNEKIAEFNRLLPKIRETLKKEQLLRRSREILPIAMELEQRTDNLYNYHTKFEEALSSLKRDIESDLQLYRFIIRAISPSGNSIRLNLEEIQPEFLIEYLYLMSIINSDGRGPKIYKEDLFENFFEVIAFLSKEDSSLAKKVFHLFSQELYNSLKEEFFKILI